MESGEAKELGEDEGSKVREELEGYLNKRMRVSLSDGRVIDGMFLCTDKDCNMVLGNCEEFLSQEEVGRSGVLGSIYSHMWISW